MGDVAIRVEGLGKQYRIGRRQEEYRTLRDALADAAMVPVRALQALVRRKGNRRNTFEVFWALRDVSFEVQRGEVLGIIGRNGAGKSTLLKILSRITEPAEGYAEVHGRVGSLLEVGTGFHPELSGRENIYLSGAILGMRRAEIKRKFDEIVAFAEVERFIDTPVKHFSTGMYLRLAFSVAAHLDPEILLVDEVLAVGDDAFQKKCLGKMGEVAGQGRTVLFVSHNMKAISNLTQRSIWVENGRIAASGETDLVINRYISQLNRLIPSEGWADLSNIERGSNLTLRKAKFEWVRMLDTEGSQAGTFLEGAPITVELGFQVTQPVKSLQFGCSVETVDGGLCFFTVPSPEFSRALETGSYSVRMHINPNHLRHGDYILTLKLFADGRRQDTIGRIMKFSIQGHVSPNDNSAYMHKWVAGYFRFDYDWGPIAKSGDPLGRVVCDDRVQ